MAINPEMKVLNKQIDMLLKVRRPDRYVVSNTVDLEVGDAEDVADVDEDEAEDETAWLDDLATEIEPQVPEAELVHKYARQLVGQREGIATRQVNNMFRRILHDGQLVLAWWGYEDMPLSVEERIVEPGQRVRKKTTRVALRAVTQTDLEAFSTEERRRKDRDHRARTDTCDGADYVREQMVLGGHWKLIDWANSVIPRPGDDDDGDA